MQVIPFALKQKMKSFNGQREFPGQSEMNGPEDRAGVHNTSALQWPTFSWKQGRIYAGHHPILQNKASSLKWKFYSLS